MIGAPSSEASWRRSSRSGSNANCVEVAELRGTTYADRSGATDVIGVRDSKDRGGPVLAFAPAAWISFVNAVRADTLH